MLRPVRVTAPSVLPVSLADAKAQLRIDHSDEDGLVEDLINAAVEHFDGWSGSLGRCLISQAWKVSTEYWCRGALPFPDVQSVVIKYYDRDGTLQTLSSSQYRLIEDHEGSRVEWISGFVPPAVMCRSDAITYEMTVGYGDAATDVPSPIRRAMMMLIAHWYEEREAATESMMTNVPFGVAALTDNYRRIRV